MKSELLHALLLRRFHQREYDHAWLFQFAKHKNLTPAQRVWVQQLWSNAYSWWQDKQAELKEKNESLYGQILSLEERRKAGEGGR